MFGEIKKGTTWLVPWQDGEDYRVPAGSVSCYSTRDLVIWKNKGIALKPVIHPNESGEKDNRRKVVQCYPSLLKKL